MNRHFDAAVAGAGILGLAHAYHLARSGRRVVVFERHDRAVGASIRNFGMLWPMGQPAGPRYDLARRSVDIWTNVLREAGFWHACTGSLHLAYRDDEEQVLREFVADPRHAERGCAIETPAQVRERCPAVRGDGLRTGLWSPVEICVDPRDIVAGLPNWLSQKYGTCFEFGVSVLDYYRPTVLTTAGDWTTDHLFVCTGADYQTVFPAAFAASGLARCKLQMMRTHPVAGGWRLGPMLAAGLTLRHSPAFADCPSLVALRRRLDAELPEQGRHGIDVRVAQNGRGELLLGDSHEFGDAIEPFDKQEIDDLVLRYLHTFFAAPELRIASRWHGNNVEHPTEAWLLAQPADGAVVVTGVGGAGLTLSFGLAERVVGEMAE